MKGKITLRLLLLVFGLNIYAQAPGVYFAATGSDMSGIWVEMTTHLGNYCQTAIGYSSDTHDTLEDNHDILLTYDGPAVLYTIADNTNLAVQTKGHFRLDDITPLHYKVAYAGTFTLSLTNRTGVFAGGQNVYLLDKVTGTLTNLCQQAYFFTTGAGTFGNRFEIVYTTDGILANSSPVETVGSNIIMYKDGNSLNIDAGTMAMSDVKVYDMNGRLLRQSANMNTSTMAIDGISAERQVLLVQIGTGSGIINKKIVF